MRKYWTFFKLNLQEALEYRGAMLVWILGSFLTLIVWVSLWETISSGNLIAGYTKQELIS